MEDEKFCRNCKYCYSEYGAPDNFYCVATVTNYVAGAEYAIHKLTEEELNASNLCELFMEKST